MLGGVPIAEQGTVLVASDFEDVSDWALAEAVRWARRLAARVSLLHVVPRTLPLGTAYTLGASEHDVRAAEAALVRRAAVIQDVPVRAAVREGDPVNEIIAVIEETRPRLVVMGTAARGLLARLWLGSVATEVLRRSPVPVLTLNPRSGRSCAAGEHRGEGGTVVVPMDFGVVAKQAMQTAAEFAAAISGELCLVHVSSLLLANVEMGPVYAAEIQSEAEVAEQYLSEQAAAVGGARTILRAGDPAGGIVSLVEEISPALVVMGTHGRSGMARLALGSVAEQVVREARAPVVTVGAAADNRRDRSAA